MLEVNCYLPYVARQHDQVRVHGLQVSQPSFAQEQKEAQRADGDAKVLQVLPETHRAQGNEVKR